MILSHSACIIASMPEREDAKRPFADTQKAYQLAYETLVSGLLEEPASSLARKIAAEESRLGVHLRKMKNGQETESSPQVDSDVIAFNLNGLSVPVALPVNYRGRKGASENRHNIAQTYLFSDLLLKEVGSFYNKMTRERARYQVKAGTRQILHAMPQGSPFENLNFKKPLSDRVRDKMSTSLGGYIVPLKEALAGGATYDELRRMGYDSLKLSSARKILAERQQPAVVPRAIKDWGPTLALLASPETDRKKVCKLIKEVSPDAHQKYPEVFVALSEVARKAGLYPRLGKMDISFLANYLELQNEPVGDAVREVKSGKQKGFNHYFFTIKRFEDEIKQLFLQAVGPRFDQMRVAPIRVIGPVPEKMPNMTDLMGRRVKGVRVSKYSPFFNLLAPYGITHSGQLRRLNVSLEDLVGQNPPVSVFKDSNQFLVADVDRRTLGVHLGKELVEKLRQSLGILAPEKM